MQTFFYISGIIFWIGIGVGIAGLLFLLWLASTFPDDRQHEA